MTQLTLTAPLNAKEKIAYEYIKAHPDCHTYDIQDYFRAQKISNCGERYARWAQEKGWVEGYRYDKSNNKKWRVL